MLRANHISQTAESAEEAKISNFLQANDACVTRI